MAPTEKQLKASLKEGGKKGQDLAGMSDMGGVKFFSVAVESANGDWELMDAVLRGMNKEVDPEADGRKGGAGDLAKCLLYANDDNLLMLCHVPDKLAQVLDQKEWFGEIVNSVGGQMLSEEPVVVDGDKESQGKVLKAHMPANPDKNQFPLKSRDVGIARSFEFLVSKGLVRPEESDGSVEFEEDIEW